MVIEKSESVRLMEVERIVEKIVEVTKIVEVIKPVVRYIIQEKPIKVVVERIV